MSVRLLLFLPLALACTVNVPRSEQEPTLRVAFGSCIKDPASPIWTVIDERSPNLVLFLGDNVYFDELDLKSLERMRARYDELHRSDGLKRLLRREHYAIWDDHDFGPNNADRTFRNHELARRAFREMWPNNPPSNPELGDSIAFSLTRADTKFVFTDGRTFRLNPGKSKSQMFGHEQLAWIRTQLLDSSPSLIVLVSGTPLLAPKTNEVGAEGLFQYPEEERELYDIFHRMTRPLIILSGGKHYAELLKRSFGENTILELSTSPLAAPLVPAELVPPDYPYRRAKYTSFNFGELEVHSHGRYRLSLRDSRGAPVVEYSQLN